MPSHQRSGFSLLQLSLILVIGGLILAATLPGGSSGDRLARERITLERMERIEAATQLFMAANQRRPYPSDITATFSSASYGVELSLPTDYSSIPTTHFTTASTAITFTTTIDSNLLTVGTTTALNKSWLVSGTGIRNYSWIEGITSSTEMTLNQTATASGTASLYFRNPLVAGGVPTKTLGLPDDYGVDGFGRRIVYMVDQRVTYAAGCSVLQNNNLRGALALSNSSTFATGTYDNVMWSLLSYGEDGQGAVGIQGAALSNRIKTGNVDASTINNAFYNSSQVTTYTPLGLVNKTPTSTFDDIVYIAPPTKNICALGKSYSTNDFRIDGGGSGDSTATAALGDINGDGYFDLVYGVPQQNVVRVIYGMKFGWPSPTTAYTSSAVDGSNGFTITKGTENISNFGGVVSVGDINGDGYDDLVIGGTPTTTADTGYAVFFGAANEPSSVSISTFSGTTGFLIKNLSSAATSYVAVGDVNGDGYDDIALPYDAGSSDWAVGLIYGKASGWGTFTLNNANLTGLSTTGVYFNVTNVVGPPAKPDATTGDISFGRAGGTDLSKQLMAICDVNNDGYKDLIVPGVIVDATISPQRMYAVLGQTGVWTNASGLIAVDSSVKSKQLTFPTLAAGSSPTYDIKGLGCKDINNDGYDDLMFYLKGN